MSLVLLDSNIVDTAPAILRFTCSVGNTNLRPSLVFPIFSVLKFFKNCKSMLRSKVFPSSSFAFSFLFTICFRPFGTLINDNCFVFHKSRVKKIIKKNEVMKQELKRESNISDEFQPIAMSVIGDPGDDVTGIKNIGPKTFIDLFPMLKNSIGSMEDLYNNVENSKPIFNSINDKSWNKYMKKVVDAEHENNFISNNLKLVSFELISRALDKPSSTEMIKKKNHIYDILNNEKIVKLEVMKEALNKTGVFLESDDLDSLYFNP